jgi:transposase
MMHQKDILLAVDYHLENLEIRQLNGVTGEERRWNQPTTPEGILEVVEAARKEIAPYGGQVFWIMESTTGWARVKDLIGDKAQLVLANVLQMPLPPKAKRRKTDKIDTKRMLREECNGSLPRAYQPARELREIRRVVDARLDMVRRQTALKNWISHYLSHETWYSTANLWSGCGLKRLKSLKLSPADGLLMSLKIEELEQVMALLEKVEAKILAIYDTWPQAKRLDVVRGIGPITAVTILAYIGPIERFASAEELISYAGLAPGVHRSDGRGYNLRIGGGGTHSKLRYLVIEASKWLREIPRYKAAHDRVEAKRGKNVAKLVVSRMFLRSAFKMLQSDVEFQPQITAA